MPKPNPALEQRVTDLEAQLRTLAAFTASLAYDYEHHAAIDKVERDVLRQERVEMMDALGIDIRRQRRHKHG